MGNLAPGRPTLNAALNIYYSNIAINVVASLLTLVLIWFMRRNGELKVNLYLKCVLMMTFHQMIYDASLALGFPCAPSTPYQTCTSIHVGGFVYGGLGAALFSLMIIVATTYVVEFSKQPSPKQTYIAFAIVYAIILGWTIAYAHGGYHAHYDLSSYGSLLAYFNNCRFVIIGITIAILLWLQYRMRQITHGQDRSRNPLYHLTRRLIFYPIIQVVCRLGVAPYNLTYKSSIDAYPESAGGTQTFWLFVFVLFTPSAGMGAFLLFLYMQRGAKEQFCRLMCCDCRNKFVDDTKGIQMPHRRGSSKDPQAGEEARMDYPVEEGSDEFEVSNKYRTAVSNSGKTNKASRKNSLSEAEYAYEASRASTAEEDWKLFSEMDEGELMRQYIKDYDAQKADRLKVATDIARRSSALKMSAAPVENPITTRL